MYRKQDKQLQKQSILLVICIFIDQLNFTEHVSI